LGRTEGCRVIIEQASHLHGEVILEHGFPEEYDSLRSAIASMSIPLRPVEDFTTATRPKRPKRHMRKIGGAERPFLLPVDQEELNKTLNETLRAADWTTQPVAAGEFTSGTDLPRKWKGDFYRNKVFVEVEFGNVASMYRDFFKFQIASRARVGDVAVLVVAKKRLAKFFDSGVASFEAAVRDLPFLKIGVQMPICLIGFEPKSYGDIESRYEEMRALCEENGVDCHPFDVAYGADIKTEEEPTAGADTDES
jgi:hypothetical protein